MKCIVEENEHHRGFRVEAETEEEKDLLTFLAKSDEDLLHGAISNNMIVHTLEFYVREKTKETT